MNARRRIFAVLFLLMLLALDIRLFGLGDKSLWLDEANSVRVATLGQAELWAGYTEDDHPPLFYGLLEYWLQFAHNETTQRLPMAVVGAACVLLVYVLASELAGSEVALTSAGLTAFSPLLIWYSQELRPYSLLAALTLVAMLALWRLLRRPHLGWWLLFTLVSAVMLYLHYTAAALPFFELLFVLSLLATRSAARAGVLLWLSGLLVAFAAWLPWLASPSFATSISNDLIGRYVADLLAVRLNIRVDHTQVISILAILALVAALALALLTFPMVRRLFQPGVMERLRANRPVRAIASVAFIASLAIFVLPQAYTLKRELSIFWPFALIVFAWLWPWRRPGYALVAGMIGLSLAASLVNLTLVPKDQWREVAAYIAAHYRQNDVVILEPAYMKTAFDYYNHWGGQSVGADYTASNDFLPAAACQYGRIWLVDHQVDHDPQATTQRWLDAHSAPATVLAFFRLEVRLYEVNRAAVPCVS